MDKKITKGKITMSSLCDKCIKNKKNKNNEIRIELM